MSSTSRLPSHAAKLGLLLALAIGPAFLLLRPAPDTEIRDIPWRAHKGVLQADFPARQTFHCDSNGLRQIDVALVALTPSNGAELELVLWDENTGVPLRSVRIHGGALGQTGGGGAWVPFDFEPLEDSADRTFAFTVAAVQPGAAGGHFSVFQRYRGQLGRHVLWGDRSLPVVRPKGQFQSPLGNLSALAFAFAELPLKEGAKAKLRLLEMVDGELVDDVTVQVESDIDLPVFSGWFFFEFEAIPDSRGKTYQIELDLPDGSRVVGNEHGMSLMSFHGGAEARGRVDLVFRSWADRDLLARITRLHKRAGTRLWLGAAAWLTSILLLARIVFQTAGNKSEA